MKFLDRNTPQFSQAEVKQIVQRLYGFTGKLTPLYSERDQNFRIKTASGEAYIIKISNTAEAVGVCRFTNPSSPPHSRARSDAAGATGG